jgi:SAM-dependent methyltransferase
MEEDSINLWTVPEHARDYLARRRDIPHRDEGYAAMLEHLPASPSRILDLGTGDGYVVGLLQTVHPGAEFVAADFSPEMLRQARERFADDPSVTIVEHDLDQPLPETWGEFDAVVSAFAIHHVVDVRKRALYGEVLERLRTGGVFVNLEHVASPTPELHDEFLAAIGSSPERDDPSNKLSPIETQLAWLRDVGFAQVDCHWKWRELAVLSGVRPA